MRHTKFEDLYVMELEDLLSAENQLIEALPGMAKAAETEDLSAALMTHLAETKGHVERLNAVFGMLDVSPKEKTCEAMKGLIREGRGSIEEIQKGPVRDAAIIGGCQRIEHYEMAAYGTVRAFAKALGHFDQAKVLRETLEEESAANGTLTDLAVDSVNILAIGSLPVGSRP